MISEAEEQVLRCERDAQALEAVSGEVSEPGRSSIGASHLQRLAQTSSGVIGRREDTGRAVGAVPVATVSPDHRSEECANRGVLTGICVDELRGDVLPADGIR